jgi:hypothetical protein
MSTSQRSWRDPSMSTSASASAAVDGYAGIGMASPR